MWECPKCNIENSEQLDECKYCHEVRIIDKKNRVLSSRKSKETIDVLVKCIMCNKDISPNAVACPHCGEPLVNKKTQNIINREEESDNLKINRNNSETKHSSSNGTSLSNETVRIDNEQKKISKKKQSDKNTMTAFIMSLPTVGILYFITYKYIEIDIIWWIWILIWIVMFSWLADSLNKQSTYKNGADKFDI